MTSFVSLAEESVAFVVPLFLKFFQRASLEMAGDGLRDLFPTVTACISLNVFAAIFPHEHSDIAMRMLHAYTSVALMVAALISANTLVLILRTNQRQIFS